MTIAGSALMFGTLNKERGKSKALILITATTRWTCLTLFFIVLHSTVVDKEGMIDGTDLFLSVVYKLYVINNK